MVIAFVRSAALLTLLFIPLCAAEPGPCLTALDRQTILAHFGAGSPGLPLASTAKIEGPSEFQKQIKKNAALPAGLQAKLQPLPAALDMQLSPVPKGYKRVAADRYILLIAESGNIVADYIDYTRRIGHTSWLTGMWR